MKRSVSIFLASAIALTFVGCSAQSPVSSNGTGTSAALTQLAEENISTTFIFTEDGITAAGGDESAYEIDGTSLTINCAGVYAVSGSCSDGSIKIKKGTTDVTLILNGLTLTSTDTAPIVCGKSSGVTIEAADGTVNTLTDSEQNNKDNDSAGEDAENAVIKCKDGSQVVLCGTGTLNIVANGKNGIKSGTADDSGREASLTIRELTLNIEAPVNDAVNAEQTLNVESGNITISAADDALHCDMTLNVGAEDTDGPTINITACYEGIEGADQNIYSGNITIQAEDDCLNAANSSLTDYNFTVNIYGGSIVASSSAGDGFDSNGDMTISGGTVVVWTANTADNQPLDADGTITITGGTVLAAGGSNGMSLSINASQGYVTYGSTGGMGFGGAGGGSLFNQGEAFTIQDADGNTVYSGSAVYNTNYLFFSSADVTADGTYSLNTSDSAVSEANAQTGESPTMTEGGPAGEMQQPSGQQPPQGMNGQQPGDGTTMTPPQGMGEPPTSGAGGTPPELPSGQQPAASGTTTT